MNLFIPPFIFKKATIVMKIEIANKTLFTVKLYQEISLF